MTALLTLFFLPLACLETPEEPAPEQVVEEQPDAPTPAPEPEPLMRRPSHCCETTAYQELVRHYLNLADPLVRGSTEGLEPLRLQVLEYIQAEQDPSVLEVLSVFLPPLQAMEACELEACRESYGQLSDLLVEFLGTQKNGELDLAIAWSRDAGHHWIQEGADTRTPYGDTVASFAWGTRAEVEAYDANREVERKAQEGTP